MPNKNVKRNTKSDYQRLFESVGRLEGLISEYSARLGDKVVANAFVGAGMDVLSQPQIQNRRIKGIGSLPCDYTVDKVGAFLRSPYEHERELRQTVEGLKWTVYPFAKILKTISDIPTYRYYSYARYIDQSDIKSNEYRRESMLVDKLNATIDPSRSAHRICAECAINGKVFYIARTSLDKSHNKINHAFLQRLPQDWCVITGYNNISRYTVMFDMMYFTNPGTDPRDYGDVFTPYLDDFLGAFEKKGKNTGGGRGINIKFQDTDALFYPERVKRNALGSPEARQVDGRWMYYVTLPPTDCWTFEIDPATPAVISPLAGMSLTLAQLSDFEAAQLSIVLNPLIKIFTGELPYYKNDNMTPKESPIMLKDNLMFYFYRIFEKIMQNNNTSGAALYLAPAENVKSHDFAEAQNANDIAKSYNAYNFDKAGLSGIIPADEDVKAGQVESSRLIEGRYATSSIYPQFTRMMETIYKKHNLTYDWAFVMFGDIFSEKTVRENAEKAKASGDLSAYYILAALDGVSLSDKISMLHAVRESGLSDLLSPPPTAYTQSGSEKSGGRPTRDISKALERGTSESAEKAIDIYGGASEE